MDYNPSVFHRELKNNYGSVPQSPTAYNPSVFHRELKKIYEIVPQSLMESPTVLPMYITDDITDGLPTSRSACMSDTCLSAHIPTDRKVWQDFLTFLVRISINFQRYYRHNLMSPTTINVRRKNCHIKHPLPSIWFIFLSRLSFASSPFLFSSPVAFGFFKRFYYFSGSFKRYVFFFLYLCIFFILIMIIFFGCSLFCVLFVDKILNSTHY